MIDITKILLAETSSEILELTQTTNLTDAENITINHHELSMRTGKPILSRIILGVLGSFFLYVSPSFFIFLPLGIFLLYIAFFFKRIGQKHIRKKFETLRITAKSLDNYPELMVEKSISTLIPRSALASQAAKIRDVGQMYTSTDNTKHQWNHAGFCRIDTSRGKDKADWQRYYVFVYTFKGTAPQTVLLHTGDRLLLSASPDNIILKNVCPPWQVITAEQYEIESLSILTEDLALKLHSLSKDNPPCTIEFFESNLLCFIPAKETNLDQLLSFEIIADSFAQTLIPNLNESKLTLIGNIPPTLAFNNELNEEDTPLSEPKKRQNVFILLTIVLFISIFFLLLKASEDGILSDDVLSPKYIALLPVILFFVIFFMLPRQFRKQAIDRSGLRINGHKVNVRRDEK